MLGMYMICWSHRPRVFWWPMQSHRPDVLRESKADRLCAGEDRYSRHIDPGAASGSQPCTGGMGSTNSRSTTTTIALTAATDGGNSYANCQSDEQRGALPSPPSSGVLQIQLQ